MFKLGKRPVTLLLALSLLALHFSAQAETVPAPSTKKDQVEAQVEHITHSDKSVVIE